MISKHQIKMLTDELNQLKEFAKLYSRRAIQEMK